MGPDPNVPKIIREIAAKPLNPAIGPNFNAILLRLNCPDDFPGCDSLRRMATGAAVSILRV